MKYENWVFGKNGALFSACSNGELELAMELRKSGASVNVASPNGFTALHRAAQKGYLNIVRFLVAEGAAIGASTADGATAASLAEKAGHKDIAAFLLDEERKRAGDQK